MKYRDDLSYDFVSSILDYFPESGKIYWKPRTPDMFEGKNRSPEHCCSIWNAKNSGKQITYKNNYNYILARIYGNAYQVSRIAWLLFYKEWPCDEIDHINGIRSDNRILNLRIANRSQQGFNRSIQKNNSVGLKGVSWCKIKNKWRSRTTIKRKEIFLGYFNTPEEAYAAYKKAAIQLHGEYVRI